MRGTGHYGQAVRTGEQAPGQGGTPGQASRLQGVLTRLSNRVQLPILTPERAWHPGIDAEIDEIEPLWLASGRTDGLPSAVAYLGALYLWNDSLDAAHGLVEKLGTPAGMLLHGILHRREGDYDNANYWFRQAGNPPCYHGLQARASAYLRQYSFGGGQLGDALEKISAQGTWNPYLFVSAVAIHESRLGENDAKYKLEHVQQLELEAVMRFLEGNLAALRTD